MVIIKKKYQDLTVVKIGKTKNFKECIEVIKKLPFRRYDEVWKVWHVLTGELPYLLQELAELGEKVIFEDKNKNEHIEEWRLKDLYHYQKEGVRFLMNTQKTILADEMGLGKTVQALRATDYPALVIAPPSLTQQWAQEVARWTNAMPFIVNTQTEKMPIDRNIVYIAGYSMFSHTKPWEHFSVIMPQDWPIKTIICDEAHKLKNIQSNQHKRVKMLIDHIKPGKIFLLTGTPLANRDPREIYALLSILGFRVKEKDFSRLFRKTEQIYIASQDRVVNRFVCVKNVDLLRNVLKEYMIRRTVREVAPELPEVRYNPVTLPIPPELATWYETEGPEAAKYFVEDRELLAGKILKKINEFRKKLSEAKIPHTLSFARDASEEESHIIIFVEFRDTAQALVENLQKSGINTWKITSEVTMNKRSTIIEDFKQNGGILVATTGTMGVGFNLDFVPAVVMHDWNWSPATISQAIKRVHRITSKISPLIILMAFENYEARILRKILTKMSTFKDVVGSEVDSAGTHQATEAILEEAESARA